MQGMLTAGKTKNKSGGYTYLMLAVVAAGLGITAAALGAAYHDREIRLGREEEFFYRGEEYVKAIASYYHAGGPAKEYPADVNSLLDDPRFQGKRHLRRLYTEPVTGGEWKYIYNEKGKLCGVYGGGSGLPVRKNITQKNTAQPGAEIKVYADYKFVFMP